MLKYVQALFLSDISYLENYTLQTPFFCQLLISKHRIQQHRLQLNISLSENKNVLSVDILKNHFLLDC